ncbi:MAG: response regulator transcription factor [Herbinix sp.]|nr:response regulator transcription factor [Herbinix sp.]
MDKILVLEDDRDLNRGISFFFEKEGYKVVSAFSIFNAKEALKKDSFDFIIMDLMLPDGNGLDLCRELREISNIPIIILTASDLEINEVVGLDSGADDYIRKPFSLSVLLARFYAVLRRKSGIKEDEILESNGINVNQKTMKVLKSGSVVDCSATEYKILCYLMVNKNQIMLKDQILECIWDQDSNFVDENTLPVNICRLRKKIEDDASNPKYIKTVHGMGYLWSEELPSDNIDRRTEML